MKKCPHCKHTIRLSRVFCPECGALIHTAPATSTPETTTDSDTNHLERQSFANRIIAAIARIREFITRGIIIGTAITATCILITGGIWYAWRVTTAVPAIASLLPRETTIAFVDANLHAQNGDIRDIMKLVPDRTSVYHPAYWISDLEARVSMYTPNYYALFGPRVGIALVGREQAEPAHVLFLSVRDAAGVEAAIGKSLTSTQTLTLGQTMYFVRLDDKYLIASPVSEILDTIGADKPERLADSAVYGTLRENLSRGGLMTIYLKPQQALHAILDHPDSTWTYDMRYTLLLAAMHQMSDMLVNVSANASSAITLDIASMPVRYITSVDAISEESLYEQITANDAIAIGGNNLGSVLRRALEEDSGNPLSFRMPLTVLNTDMIKQVSRSIRDIDPALIDHPYLVSFNADTSIKRLSLVTDEQNVPATLRMVTDILDGYAPYLHPIVQTTTLPDGTIAQELLVRHDARSVQTVTALNGAMITTIAVPETAISLSFLHHEGILHIARTANVLQNLVAESPLSVGQSLEPDNRHDFVYISIPSLISLEASDSPWQLALARYQQYLAPLQSVTHESWHEQSVMRHTVNLIF